MTTPAIIETLSRLLRQPNVVYTLYVNPRVFLQMTGSALRFQIADCPSGFCFIYARDARGEKHWLTLRDIPGRNTYYCAAVESGQHLLQLYESIDKHYFLNRRPAELTDGFRRRFFEIFYKVRETQDTSIYEAQELWFRCVEEEYEYAGELIAESRDFISAVDRISPETWNDPKLQSYKAAWAQSKANKQRLHIFDATALADSTIRAAYNDFIAVHGAAHGQMGTELFFRDAATVKGARADGFLIIDGKVVLTTQVEQPTREPGGIFFRDAVITKYTNRLKDLLSPPHVLRADEFLRNYLTE